MDLKPYTIDELGSLKQRAIDFCRPTWPDTGIDQSSECSWLYRNKEARYFETIRDEGGMMKTRTKDDSGDIRSPINGRLDGLFFSASLYNGALPTISPFGPERLLIPSNVLLNERMCLYFADFYCAYESSPHYIILVITRRNSNADMFCKSNLVCLDLHDNPFLFYRNGVVRVSTSHRLWVEVFYTEDLQVYEYQPPDQQNSSRLALRKDAVMYTVEHRERSGSGVVRKFNTCDICNM